MLHFIAAHKIAIIATTAVVAVAGGGAGLKVKSDSDAHAKQVHAALVVKQQKAAQAAQEAAAQEAARQAAAQQAAKEAEQQAAADVAKTELEKMILKDAQQKASDGLFDPVSKVDCQSAATVATDLNQGSFSCLAVSSTSSDGTERGYSYVGTANYQTGEISAHLGHS